jgi:hypothetical protein
MNKQLLTIGNIIFDYLIITLIGILSLLLIVPFIPIYVGIIGYFVMDRDDRDLKGLFLTIKSNIKIISLYTIFILILTIIPILNILLINKTDIFLFETIFLGINYVVLILDLIFVINGPIIIIKMNVNFKQLLFNSFMLIFGGLINFLTGLGLIVIYLYVGFENILLFILGFYFVVKILTLLISINLNKLKEIQI